MAKRVMRIGSRAALIFALAVLFAPSTAGAFAFTYDWQDPNDPPFRGDGLPNAHYWAPCVSSNLNGAECTLTITYNLAKPFNARDLQAVNAAVGIWQNRTVVELNQTNLGAMGQDDAAVSRAGRKYDLQTDLTHELGHAFGLAHPEMGRDRKPITDEPQPPPWVGDRTKFTASTRGDRDAYHLDAGRDGTPGTADDQRDADKILDLIDADNNPFNAPPGNRVDKTTYKAMNGALPQNTSAQAPTRSVAGKIFNNNKIEAAMVQDLDANATRRVLTWDDVAGIRYLEAGRDQVVDGDAAAALDNYRFKFAFEANGANADPSGDPPANIQILISKAPPNTLDRPLSEATINRSKFEKVIVSLLLGAASESDATFGTGSRDIIGRTEMWLDSQGQIGFVDIYIPIPEPAPIFLFLAAIMALFAATATVAGRSGKKSDELIRRSVS